MFLSSFQLAGGSVAGRDHRGRGGVPRNCQDAYHLHGGLTAHVVMVADGCGSGKSSEVGAEIGTRMGATFLCQYLERGLPANGQMLERVRQDLIGHLRVVARNMGSSLSEVVNRYFLFTLLGAIITEETAIFFAIGDGVIVVNGEIRVLEPEAGNQPIYLGYALTGSSLTDENPDKLRFQIVKQLPTAELQHFLVGTDGVSDAITNASRNIPGTNQPFGPISQFWEGDQFFSNPVAITRRLNLMARDWPQKVVPESGRQVVDSGLLPDDTTFVVGRRATVQGGSSCDPSS